MKLFRAFLTASLASVALLASAVAQHLVFEAEEGMLHGGVRIASELPGHGGRGYVTNFTKTGDAVDITVTVPTAGFYTLGIRYAAAGGDKFNPIFVDGAFMGSGRFPNSDGFTEMCFGRIHLGAKTCTLRIGHEWGGISVDSISLDPAPEPVAFRLSPVPVFADASPEARRLLSYLNGVFQKRVISGQHGEADFSFIAKKTGGNAPMLLGLDLLFYSGSWNKPEGDGAIEKALDWYRNKHGLVTICWHWFSPSGSTDQIWNSFYTDKTRFDVSRISDETSPEYKGLVADIDLIASKLKVLRDAGVPVLWRPLHEAEGKWFWWGAQGPEACKKLYRLMYDRFTRIHKLDNLLWVWTTSDTPNSLQWYPGDDCVDIVGADIYPPKGSGGSYLTVFDNIRRITGGKKLIALSENGAIPDPELLVKDRADWLWFMTWDKYASDPASNSPELVTKTFKNERVIVLGKDSPLEKR